MIPKRNPQAGFSLIEMVVTLSVFSLVIGLLYSGFWTSTRLLTRDDSDIRQLEQRLLVQRLVPKWLENATVTTEANRSKQLYFLGSEKSITFFSMQKHYTDTPVLYKIQITIENSDRSNSGTSQLKVVQRIEKPFFAQTGNQANIQQSVLTFDSEIRGFSYLPTFSQIDTHTKWQKEWTLENQLPYSIRLEIGNGDEIITFPRTRLDAECLSRRGIEGLEGRFCGTLL